MTHRGILRAIAATAAISFSAAARDADACGGCFHEPTPPTQSGTVVTDHRMIFSISTQQTTLYDEIKYSGSPSSFAWVLPIRSTVTVGLSDEAVFNALEQNTRTEILAPPLPQCPPCNCGGKSGGFAGSGSSGGGSSSSSGGGVTVLREQTVGPYAAVQLQSTDPMALDNWLSANGYVIPSDIESVIAAYVADGFDFLALKLLPGQGVQSMRPVRVTSPGAALSLPLRMVAAGTGAIVGITLWVIADGRYEPANFGSFTVSPSDLVWDWAMSESTYSTVQVQKEAASQNTVWQIESSLVVSPVVIESAVMYGVQQPGVGSSSGFSSSSSSSGSGSANGYIALPGPDGGTSETAAQAEADDLAALFPEGNTSMRITRMRTDLAHTALANDLVLTAPLDQSTLSNVYQVTKSVNAPQCPVCNCGGVGGSSGASSSGALGSSGGVGSSGAVGGSGGLGTSSGTSGSSGSSGSPGESNPAGAGDTSGVHGSSGCAAAPSEPDGLAAQLIVAGFATISLLRGRRQRRRPTSS